MPELNQIASSTLYFSLLSGQGCPHTELHKISGVSYNWKFRESIASLLIFQNHLIV